MEPKSFAKKFNSIAQYAHKWLLMVKSLLAAIELTSNAPKLMIGSVLTMHVVKNVLFAAKLLK